MKKLFAVAAALAVIFATSQLQAVTKGVQDTAPNSSTMVTNKAVPFVTQNTFKDSLIDVASSDSSVTVSVTGATKAVLQVVVFIEEGDQSDTIEVNVATTPDNGTSWSAFVPIDSLLVTGADAATEVHTVDLLSTAVNNNLGTFGLDQITDFRLRFDSIGLASDDTLHVSPYLTEIYTRQSAK